MQVLNNIEYSMMNNRKRKKLLVSYLPFGNNSSIIIGKVWKGGIRANILSILEDKETASAKERWSAYSYNKMP